MCPLCVDMCMCVEDMCLYGVDNGHAMGECVSVCLYVDSVIKRPCYTDIYSRAIGQRRNKIDW